MNPALFGLYAITPTSITDTDLLTRKVEQALVGGARLIQYRDKSTDTPRRRETAQRLREFTHQHQALLLINDDIELALHCAADGVHLGREDTDLAQARAQLGPQAIIGISCYNRFELAQQAAAEGAAQGADYIAFGSFFPSRTKPEAVRADPSLLHQAQALHLPVAAIGGITLHTAPALIQAGAHMLAVVEAVFGAEDVEAAARRFSALFPSPAHPRPANISHPID